MINATVLDVLHLVFDLCFCILLFFALVAQMIVKVCGFTRTPVGSVEFLQANKRMKTSSLGNEEGPGQTQQMNTVYPASNQASYFHSW